MSTNILAKMTIALGADASGVAKGIATAKKDLAGLVKYGENLKSLGQSMSMYLTAPIGLMGGMIVKTAGDFEASMKKVEAITGSTGKELESLSDMAKKMGIETKYSASEAADAMTFLGMAGFDAKETLAAIPDVLSLAAAGGIELGRAADIASNVMGQFGIQAENTARVTNVMAATISSSNTNMEQLAEAFKYLGPTAQSLGISIEDTAAVIGVLGDAGIQGSLAGRALGTSLVSLAKPTPKAAAAMKALSVAAFDAKGNFVGMPSLLKQIEEGSKGMTQQQKAANLQAMLGAEAFQEINILLERGSQAYADYSKKITGTNKAQEMATKQSEGFNGAIKTLQSAFEGLQLAIADSGILEWATKLVSGLANMLRGLAKTNPAMLKLVTVVGLAVAALGPLSLVIGTLITLVPTFVAGLTAITGAFGSVGAAAAAAWAAITGPVGLVVIGLAAVATGVYFLAKAFPSVTQQAEKATDALREQQATLKKLTTDIQPLVSRYEELKKKSRLSQEEQKELESIVRKIAAAVPGATTEVDKYGRAIGISTDRVKTFIAENKALEESMRQSALSAKTKELQTYEKQLKKVEERAAAANMGSINGMNGSMSGPNKSELAKLGKEADALKEKIAAVRAERRALFQEGQEGMGPNQTPTAATVIDPVLDPTATEAGANKIRDILQKLEADFALAAKKAQLFGSEIDNQNGEFKTYGEGAQKTTQYVSTMGLSYDAAADKAKALQTAIDELLKAGVSAKDSRMVTLKGQLEALNNVDLSPMENSLETAFRNADTSILEFAGNLQKVKELIKANYGEISGAAKTFFDDQYKMAAAAEEQVTAMAGMVHSALVDTMSGISEVMGNAFAGISMGAGDIANSILMPFAEMAVTLGKYAIGIGVGIEAIKASFESMTGIGAIAAGVALVALGSAAKAALGGMAKKGGGYSPNINAAPAKIAQPKMPSQQEHGPKEIRLRVQGHDLVAAFSANQYYVDRIR